MANLEILGREGYFPALPRDVKLSTGQAAALLHIGASKRNKEFESVFQKKVREGKDITMKGLCDMDLVYGSIKKGSTEWGLTQLGGMVVTSLEILVTDYATRIEQRKVSLRPLPFYEKLKLDYYSIDNTTSSEFMDDLLAEHGVVGNPKAGRAFNLAWQYGSSAGHYEVANYFSDLVDLIKD